MSNASKQKNDEKHIKTLAVTHFNKKTHGAGNWGGPELVLAPLREAQPMETRRWMARKYTKVRIESYRRIDVPIAVLSVLSPGLGVFMLCNAKCPGGIKGAGILGTSFAECRYFRMGWIFHSLLTSPFAEREQVERWMHWIHWRFFQRRTLSRTLGDRD